MIGAAVCFRPSSEGGNRQAGKSSPRPAAAVQVRPPKGSDLLPGLTVASPEEGEPAPPYGQSKIAITISASPDGPVGGSRRDSLCAIVLVCRLRRPIVNPFCPEAAMCDEGRTG